MKKYLLRTIAFGVAFAVGVGLIWSLSLFNFGDDKRAEIAFCALSYEAKNIVEVSPNGKVEVRFKEFVTSENGLAMKFEIVNKNTKSAYYSAYSSAAEDKKGFLISEIKIDGKEEKRWTCGTGLKTFELKSGEFITHTVFGGAVAQYLEKGERFQIGFVFQDDKKKTYQTYWSDDLPITEDVKRQIIKEQKQFENYQ